MTVVVFNYAGWVARFPEFQAISEPTAQAYFNEACAYCNNTDCSPIYDVNQRTIILNLLTAHIAYLNDPSSAFVQGGFTGRITSAGEGSVSVSSEYTTPGGAEWYAQSRYGQAFWQLMAAYRTFRYIPGRQPRFDLFPGVGVGPRGSYGYGWGGLRGNGN